MLGWKKMYIWSKNVKEITVKRRQVVNVMQP